jgi:hypothetical protein
VLYKLLKDRAIIMKEKMKMPGSEKGVSLDGVPRTLN